MLYLQSTVSPVSIFSKDILLHSFFRKLEFVIHRNILSHSTKKSGIYGSVLAGDTLVIDKNRSTNVSKLHLNMIYLNQI